MNLKNAKTLGTVHTHTHTLCLQDTRIGVQSGESCKLKNTAVLVCLDKEISLPTGKLYIIYQELKVDFFI